MGKFWVRPLQFWSESALPGWNRNKVPENLDTTRVVPMVIFLILRSSIEPKFDSGIFVELSDVALVLICKIQRAILDSCAKQVNQQRISCQILV